MIAERILQRLSVLRLETFVRENRYIYILSRIAGGQLYSEISSFIRSPIKNFQADCVTSTLV